MFASDIDVTIDNGVKQQEYDRDSYEDSAIKKNSSWNKVKHLRHAVSAISMIRSKLNDLDAKEGIKDIMLSYCRRNSEAMKEIYEKLIAANKKIWIDFICIHKGEDWWASIHRGIERSGVMIVLLSPEYLESPVCRDEWTAALAMKKRIVPVVVKDVNWDNVPKELASLNFIFATDSEKFDVAVAEILAASEFDIARVERHTLYYINAVRWKHKIVLASLKNKGDSVAEDEFMALNTSRRRDTAVSNDPNDLQFLEDEKAVSEGESLLLNDMDLKDAKQFVSVCSLGGTPCLTPLHIQYFEASKLKSKRKSRRKIVCFSIAMVIVFAFVVAAAAMAIIADGRFTDLKLANEKTNIATQKSLHCAKGAQLMVTKSRIDQSILFNYSEKSVRLTSDFNTQLSLYLASFKSGVEGTATNVLLNSISDDAYLSAARSLSFSSSAITGGTTLLTGGKNAPSDGTFNQISFVTNGIATGFTTVASASSSRGGWYRLWSAKGKAHGRPFFNATSPHIAMPTATIVRHYTSLSLARGAICVNNVGIVAFVASVNSSDFGLQITIPGKSNSKMKNVYVLDVKGDSAVTVQRTCKYILTAPIYFSSDGSMLWGNLECVTGVGAFIIDFNEINAWAKKYSMMTSGESIPPPPTAYLVRWRDTSNGQCTINVGPSMALSSGGTYLAAYGTTIPDASRLQVAALCLYLKIADTTPAGYVYKFIASLKLISDVRELYMSPTFISLKFSGDLNWLAASWLSSTIKLYDISTFTKQTTPLTTGGLEITATLVSSLTNSGGCTFNSLSFSYDSKFIVGGCGSAYIWSIGGVNDRKVSLPLVELKPSSMTDDHVNLDENCSTFTGFAFDPNATIANSPTSLAELSDYGTPELAVSCGPTINRLIFPFWRLYSKTECSMTTTAEKLAAIKIAHNPDVISNLAVLCKNATLENYVLSVAKDSTLKKISLEQHYPAERLISSVLCSGNVVMSEKNKTEITLAMRQPGLLSPPSTSYYYVQEPTAAAISNEASASTIRISQVVNSPASHTLGMWLSSRWSTCSKPCNGGIQTRQNSCTGSICSLPAPAIQQACNPNPCKWVASPWSECSVGCGAGSQSRTITCQTTASVTQDDSYCPTSHGLPLSRSCNFGACGVWVSSAWSTCSKPCNGGTQTRTNVCSINTSDRSNQRLVCIDQPITQQSCNTDSCQWKESNWGTCSTRCGDGVQTRVVTCTDVASRTQDDSYCPLPKIESQKCNLGACGVWVSSAWSQCSHPCRGPGLDLKGTQTRKNECSTRVCLTAEPTREQDCNSEPCRWVYLGWSACSAECGPGSQQRTASCMTPASATIASTKELEKYCPSNPAIAQACQLKSCPVWSYSDWSSCVGACGVSDGTKTRAVTCKVDGNVVSDNNCRGSKDETSSRCDTGACAPGTLNGACGQHRDCFGFNPGQSSLCCDPRVRKCVYQKQDWVRSWYCPDECKGSISAASGTCSETTEVTESVMLIENYGSLKMSSENEESTLESMYV